MNFSNGVGKSSPIVCMDASGDIFHAAGKIADRFTLPHRDAYPIHALVLVFCRGSYVLP